ncbi:Histone-lysine n-methyltransferase atxr2 [Thalictrum thalictroides]|uniref:Histone-lysine n-methyltransferase atxr2 n=1 Tax=Thalictrum thalictroides TaxID=46969 RepID=A0A7J6WUX4_THATH|nr:Histone-lysine n-methyltransferase atxr2 [Thalictrum thalictroides]
MESCSSSSIFCQLDKEFSKEISALLKPPSPQQVQEYFDKLVKMRQCNGLKIKQDGNYGKGVYAVSDFDEGELVLKDQMLVGAQHSSNKVDCLVCSYCFRFIGSIELQIGRKLYLQNLGLSARMECATESSDEEDDSLTADHDKLGQCSSSNPKKKIPLPKETIESVMNGYVELPYSKQFPLPSAVSCSGGCGEAYYCSEICAEADWEFFHSLLCTGKSLGTPSREALLKFIQHADGTNDIFYLAAKAISLTILRYKKSKAAQFQEGKHNETNGNDISDFSLLLEAWKPISMGYKRRWWDCVALPDDVDYHDEASFREQIRELAFEVMSPGILNIKNFVWICANHSE